MAAAKENFFAESKDKLKEYLKDRLLLLKVEGVEKGSRIIATMFSILLISILSFFVLLFLSIMLAYFFGEKLHHIFWGFGIIAGFYIVLLACIIAFRKSFIEKQIMNVVIDIAFETSNEEHKQEQKNEQ